MRRKSTATCQRQRGDEGAAQEPVEDLMAQTIRYIRLGVDRDLDSDDDPDNDDDEYFDVAADHEQAPVRAPAQRRRRQQAGQVALYVWGWGSSGGLVGRKAFDDLDVPTASPCLCSRAPAAAAANDSDNGRFACSKTRRSWGCRRPAIACS